MIAFQGRTSEAEGRRGSRIDSEEGATSGFGLAQERWWATA